MSAADPGDAVTDFVNIGVTRGWGKEGAERAETRDIEIRRAGAFRIQTLNAGELVKVEALAGAEQDILTLMYLAPVGGARFIDNRRSEGMGPTSCGVRAEIGNCIRHFRQALGRLVALILPHETRKHRVPGGEDLVEPHTDLVPQFGHGAEEAREVVAEVRQGKELVHRELCNW